jgi:hypothetical protein
MQKLGRAEILMGFKDDPLINQKEIRMRLFDAASVDRVEDLFTPPPNPQIQQLMMQIALEEKEAELGRLRAAELKDNSQAYLNMAMASSKANGPQMDWINAQLRIMELHIEATNTQVRAADVESRHRIGQGRLTNDAQRNRQDIADAGTNISSLPPPSALPPFPQMPGGAGPAAPGTRPGGPAAPPGPPGGGNGSLPLPPLPAAAAGPVGPPAPPIAPTGNGFDPTMLGAKQAPDGRHYLPDPRRPGKFLMVA